MPDKIKRQRLNDSGYYNDDRKNTAIPIHTVYVGDIEAYITDEIRDHFRRFGEIDTIAVRSKSPHYHYCLVQFKYAEDAGAALLHTEKNWNEYEVRAADALDQPNHPLQVPPESDSESNILVALNNDCVLEIFKHLNAPDLTNVANVCASFNELAKIAFASKYKHLNIAKEFNHHRDLIKPALKYFGKDIRSLCILSCLFKTEANVIHLIGENFGAKLKQLELRSFRFQADMTAMRPIFAQIEKLTLDGCYGSITLDQSMAGCANLKSLTLSLCENIGQHRSQYVMNQTFPKLQEFTLYRTEVNNESFNSFINRHPNLTDLSIFHSFSSHVFRLIGR